MDYRIREMRRQEYGLLEDFLYEAIFVPEGVKAPPKTITAVPELRVYVEGFGDKEGDAGLVAEMEDKVIGAVWARIMDDYGHLDDETPSLAISLYKEYRGHGIGTALMEGILVLLKERGFARVSLSVQKDNYAVRMYRRVGFQVVRESEEEFVMGREL
ncbi:N-acetyltransferase [bacterium 1XD21-13]|nr:N-acetyltransferase [bacterium 1XD21-13]